MTFEKAFGLISCLCVLFWFTSWAFKSAAAWYTGPRRGRKQ